MTTAGGSGSWFSWATCKYPSGISDLASCQGPALADQDEEALRELKVLSFDGWELSAVSRMQEPLNQGDVLAMHGFIVGQLTHKDQAEPRFFRLDWGAGGLVLQVRESTHDFTSFAERASAQHAESASRAAATTRGSARTAGAAVLVGVCAMRVAVQAEFTGLAAIGGALSFMGAGGVLAASFAVAGGAGIWYGISCVGQRDVTLEYRPTLGEAPLRRLIRAIQAKKDQPYDVIRWNCNHFTDEMIALVTADT